MFINLLFNLGFGWIVIEHNLILIIGRDDGAMPSVPPLCHGLPENIKA
jgi:hypothetical protein